jgi:hypothetical protein
MVGQLALDQHIGVRLPASQPRSRAGAILEDPMSANGVGNIHVTINTGRRNATPRCDILVVIAEQREIQQFLSQQGRIAFVDPAVSRQVALSNPHVDKL